MFKNQPTKKAIALSGCKGKRDRQPGIYFWVYIYCIKRMRSIMKLPDIDKKLKQGVLLTKVWVWAAMHSPNFRHCQLYLSRPFMEARIDWVKHGYEHLLIQIKLQCPKLCLDTPSHLYSAFSEATKEPGEIIPDPIDDIPF